MAGRGGRGRQLFLLGGNVSSLKVWDPGFLIPAGTCKVSVNLGDLSAQGCKRGPKNNCGIPSPETQEPCGQGHLHEPISGGHRLHREGDSGHWEPPRFLSAGIRAPSTHPGVWGSQNPKPKTLNPKP